MTTPPDISNTTPVTMVISEIVTPKHQHEYENWVAGINQVVKKVEGFIGVDVIRPRDKTKLEYVVILRFDSYDNLSNWRKSGLCIEWLEKAEHMVVRQVASRAALGMEMWFNMSEKQIQSADSPPFYKQVTIGILAVYPLVFLIDHTIGPHIQDLNYFVRIFISVSLISTLITFPMMPMLTKLLNKWLYPKD